MIRVRKSRMLQEAELDITAFMNLMIVLVPVLLLGMVFSQITVLDIKLPEASAGDAADSEQKKQLELIIRKGEMLVNYPQGILLKRIPRVDVKTEQADVEAKGTATVEREKLEGEESATDYDYKLLSLVLQEVKRQFREKQIENRSINILSEADTDYQTIISTMDTVRSYKAVVAVSVVDAELFPEVSFGDAPKIVSEGVK
jgi:biopolymer transport protein ExbD